MNITITGRHLEITPAIRQHAEEKANKLTKYYDLIQEIEVILDGSEAKQKRAELVVNAEHRLLLDAIVRRDVTDGERFLSGHIRRTRIELARHPEVFA